MQSVSQIYEFGAFRLEANERRLLRNGQPVPLRAKVFDTLLTLVANHGSLVTKDTLMRAVWPDAVVEEGNLAHNMVALRKALGDKDTDQHHVETVPGKGYRFVASVQLVAGQASPARPAVSESRPEPWEERLDAARAALIAKRSAAARGGAIDSHVVGRTREQGELLAALEAVRAGQAQMLCVTGEPGIGKSTLVEWFLTECGSRGADCAVAIGRCSERLAESEAYLPVLDALDNLLSGAWGAECGELMKVVAPTWYVQVAPLWASSAPSLAGVVSDARAASRERMKRELAAFFEEIARVAPVVLFVDDLHWADASTTELLAYLARKLASACLLMVVAYRSSDMVLTSHPFIAVRQELQRHGVCRELPMGLLSHQDIEQYLRLELPAHSLPRGFAEFIHGRTEGNPLFMTELIRHLRERGPLDGSLDSLERDLPESVRSMIERRVGRLDQDEVELLAAAAVQGQVFDSRIIADVLKLDAAVVEERLLRLDRMHAFVRRLHEKEFPDASISVSYSFAHVLYQHAIEEVLTPSRKAALNQTTAEALLFRHREHVAPVASRLAMLFEAARDFRQAADFYIAAAANAARLYANEEAVSLSRRAIANAEKLQGNACHVRIAAAALALGQLQMVLSRFPEAEADFDQAEAAAQAAGEVEAQVNAICAGALARFYQRRMEQTGEFAGRALAIAQAAGSALGTASAEAVLGLERLCYGAVEDAEKRFAASVPVLIRQTPPPHALEALTFSGLLRAWQLDYAASHRITDWTMQQARDLGLSYHIVLNLFVRGMARFNQGRLSEGIRDLHEGMRLAEKNGERFWLSRFPNTLGWVYRELQDIDTALRLDAEGAQTARENGYAKPEAYSHVNLAQDYMAVGETTRVLEHLNRAMELFGADVWFRWRYHIRAKAELARYWLLQGDTRQARQYALESVEIAEPRKIGKHLAWAHKILGDVAMAEDRLGDARGEYETAAALLDPHRCPLIQWRVLLAAAEAASARHESPLADQYRNQCRHVIHGLAESLTDEKLRRQFLGSEAIRRALE
jgi:DNA-binding winged helix-turn-helix (wHTH) protein/tetratricopeptide (TPR) repeat protein